MIKIDLITGFLGAGKTTFLKEYVKYLKNNNEKICVLENDYGAINIDMMLLNDLDCDSEMVLSGYDYDCHKRRFKTKLISMAMRGYTRIVVEPSGIFDTDEFFDTLYEEPLDSFYEIGNVITIVDSTEKYYSDESKYILTSEIASAGAIILKKRDLPNSNKELAINLIKDALKCNNCNKNIDNIIYDEFDFKNILKCGYNISSYEKKNIIENNNYNSLFFMDKKYTIDELKKITNELLNKDIYGHVIRIKGYYKENELWYNINVTKSIFEINKIKEGQDVIIIIGENLNNALINDLLERK